MERKSETENSILLPLVNTQLANLSRILSIYSRDSLRLARFRQLTDV